jgi:hypothetical protein
MARTFCPGPCCCLSGDQSIRRAQPRRLLRRRGNLLHRRLVVGVIYRTKPWRRAPALLLRLIEPRATCTLLVHSPSLDLSVWWFFFTSDGCRQRCPLDIVHIPLGDPPGCTDRYKTNRLLSHEGRVKPLRQKSPSSTAEIFHPACNCMAYRGLRGFGKILRRKESRHPLLLVLVDGCR